MIKEVGKCEMCINFIPNVTVVDDSGFEIFGYGCMLGGSCLSEETFFKGCKELVKGNDS